MEIYRVSFVGHREIPEVRNVEQKIEDLIRELLFQKEYVEFYIGRSSAFDILVASVIKRVQKDHGKHNSSLILVLPYHVKDEAYYEEYYDEVVIPLERNTHFKAAIVKRNEWMIDHSELLVAYVKNEYGGAYNTMKYAERKGVEIINMADDRE